MTDTQRNFFAPCGQLFYCNFKEQPRVIGAHIRICTRCKQRQKEGNAQTHAQVKPKECAGLRKMGDPMPPETQFAHILDEEFLATHVPANISA